MNVEWIYAVVLFKLDFEEKLSDCKHLSINFTTKFRRSAAPSLRRSLSR